MLARYLRITLDDVAAVVMPFSDYPTPCGPLHPIAVGRATTLISLAPGCREVALAVINTDIPSRAPFGDRVDGVTYDIDVLTLEVARVSTAPEGGFDPAVSGDGSAIAYTFGGVSDSRIALHDVASATTGDLGAATLAGDLPDLNHDGSVLAFESQAPLRGGDSNDTHDVFRMDIGTSDLVRVSNTPSGLAGNDSSGDPTISADASTIAWWSGASDIGSPPEDPFGLHIYARQGVDAERLSVSTGGAEDDCGSQDPAISADAAFASCGATLHPTALDYHYQIYVKDTDTGGLGIASATGTGSGNNDSVRPAITAGGRFVAYESRANNLAADLLTADSNNAADVYLTDRETGVIELISMTPAGAAANGHSGYPAVSQDGRFVTFWSVASNLVPGDTNAAADIFLRDRISGTTIRLSVTSTGAQAAGGSWSPDISADGTTIAFYTSAQLVPSDTDTTADVYSVRIH